MKPFLYLIMLFAFPYGGLAQAVTVQDAKLCRRFFTDSVRMQVDVCAYSQIFEKLRTKDRAAGIASVNDGKATGNELNNRVIYGGREDENARISARVQDMYDRIHLPGYDAAADRARLKRLIRRFRAEAATLPSFYRTIDHKFDGDADRYVDYLFDHSLMGNADELERFKKKLSRRRLERDPLLAFTLSVLQYISLGGEL